GLRDALAECGEPILAPLACTTGDLHRHDHELPRAESGNIRADLHDLGDELVAERERADDGKLAADGRNVRVAGGDSNRSDERVVRPLEPGVRRLLPFQSAGFYKGELFHSASFLCGLRWMVAEGHGRSTRSAARAVEHALI